MQSRPVQWACLVNVGSVAKQQCGQVVLIVQNSWQRKKKTFRMSKRLLWRSDLPVPATNGESCSSFWSSGLQPFCSKKVAFSLSPWTTARKRGVSPFRVRHWAAPGGEAENARRMSESHEDSGYRCNWNNLRRQSQGSFYSLVLQLRAVGSILVHPLWKRSLAALPVCPVHHGHLNVIKII